MQGSSKRLSVTQRTATFLTHTLTHTHTHTLINSPAKPLYRCQGTFSFKCCYHTYLRFIHSKAYAPLHKSTHTHTHTHTHTLRHFSMKRRESGSARRGEGKKEHILVHSWTHTCRHTHTRARTHTHTHTHTLRCMQVFTAKSSLMHYPGKRIYL